MPQEPQRNDKRKFQPQIFDFQRLFHEGADPEQMPWGFPYGSSILISGPPGSGKSTFALAVARGILLAEAWQVIREKNRAQPGASKLETDLTPQPLGLKDIENTPYRVYYVSTEVDKARLERIFESTGWFREDDLLFASRRRFRTIISRVDTARPVRSSEELINELTFKLRKSHAEITGDVKAIVIVDSLTALLRDCHDRGDERRQTHEFIHRLQTALGQNEPALTFFISEEPASASHPSTVHVEEYVVDFVFRLKLKDTGMGRRLRAIETVKSHGALLRLGEHTWSIVTRQTIDGVITSPELQHHIEGLATNYRYLSCDDPVKETAAKDRLRLPLGNEWRPSSLSICDILDLREFLKRLKKVQQTNAIEDLKAVNEYDDSKPVWTLFQQRKFWRSISKLFAKQLPPFGSGDPQELIKRIDWGTITVYPASALPKIGYAMGQFNQSPKPEAATEQNVQTPQSIVTELSSSSNPELPISTGVSGLDAMLNFTTGRDYWTHKELEPGLGSCEINGLSPGTITVIVGPAGAGKTNMCLQFLLAEPEKSNGHKDGALYINFELSHEDVISRYPHEQSREKLAKLVHIFRRRGNLDINALLAEMRFLVLERVVRRVVVDGLSSLLATTTPADYSRLIETLLSTIQDLSKLLVAERGSSPITTFMTYEPEPGEVQTLGRLPRLSAVADNLIIIQPALVNDEIRRTIYVAKARSAEHDHAIRELSIVNDEKPVRIIPGLESFTGIHSGSVGRIKLLLQLFEENEAEKRFNESLRKRLRETFNYKIESCGFSRNAITRTLDELASTSSGITSNVKVLSLDEWMVRDYSLQDKPRFLLSLEAFATSGILNSSPCDFWAWDIEKGRKGDGDRELVALPNYLDFGLFCVNPQMAMKIGLVKGLDLTPKAWEDFLDLVLLPWVIREQGSMWFASPDNQEGSIVALMRKAQLHCSKESEKAYGFTFDMATANTAAVSFLELAWSFGAPEEVFRSPYLDEMSKEKDDKKFDDFPTAWALRFLMFLAANGLMPSSPTIEHSSRSLFSRHFYSTFSDLACPLSGKPVRLWLVPFFPIGGVRPFEVEKADLEKDLADRLSQFTELIRSVLSANSEEIDFSGVNDLEAWSFTTPCMQVQGKDGRENYEAKLEKRIRHHSLDYRDVAEFLERHRLRDAFLNGSGTLADRMIGKTIEDAASRKSIPLGYCCTGSWMVGVHARTHSGGLSCQIIDEITSLESARRRAETGAGLPARKDFYEFYGDERVKDADYLSWNQILHFCGARARQRDRALPENVAVRGFGEALNRELRACLRRAVVPPNDPLSLTKVARDALRRIVEWVSAAKGKEAAQ